MKDYTHHFGMITIASALLLANSAQAQSHVASHHELPLAMDLNVTTRECSHSSGPVIVLEGNIVLPAVDVHFLFQNNWKGTHSAEANLEVGAELIPAHWKVAIPKQPSRGGVGGNPHVWGQIFKDDGTPVGPKVYLGRCVQGRSLSFDSIPLNFLSELTIDRSNSPGSNITVAGKTTFEEGLVARFTLQNNLKATHIATAEVDIHLADRGASLTLPKQPVRGGVGGNPHIWAQMFLRDGGEELSDLVYLGRCKQA
jgi:hypothetical protein